MPDCTTLENLTSTSRENAHLVVRHPSSMSQSCFPEILSPTQVSNSLEDGEKLGRTTQRSLFVSCDPLCGVNSSLPVPVTVSLVGTQDFVDKWNCVESQTSLITGSFGELGKGSQ
jgi:hypothetical protein